MSRHYATPSTATLGFDRSALPLVDVVCRVARRLWPAKTAAHLSSRAGVSARAAEFWLGGAATGLSGEAVAELLRSDAGFQILEGIMGDRKPSWWPKLAVAVAIDELERRQAETARSLEALRAQL